MPDEKDYQAIVEKIVSAGRHGPYIVAHSTELGSVTLSLESPNWQETDWPEPGTYIILSKVRKKRAGWRAKLGRFMKPSDEQGAKR